MTIAALRTPDDRFADLPGYAFAPHWLDHANGLRMHYVDEPGPGRRHLSCACTASRAGRTSIAR